MVGNFISIPSFLSRDFGYWLSASLEFFKEFNNSTFSLFEFNRNVVTFSVAWKY